MQLSYFKDSEPKGSIKFKKDPRYYGLGRYEDENGNWWDVNAVIQNYVCACKLENLHPYFKDTSDFRNHNMVFQTWEPYKIELVEN